MEQQRSKSGILIGRKGNKFEIIGMISGGITLTPAPSPQFLTEQYFKPLSILFNYRAILISEINDGQIHDIIQCYLSRVNTILKPFFRIPALVNKAFIRSISQVLEIEEEELIDELIETAVPACPPNPFYTNLFYTKKLEPPAPELATLSTGIIKKHCPNYGGMLLAPKFIVLHSTETDGVGPVINTFFNLNSKVSAHYLIGSKGGRWELVPKTRIAWHAGRSMITIKNKTYRGLNKNSIGIELVGYHDKRFKVEQYLALSDLIEQIKQSLPTIKYLTTHRRIAYPSGRKRDPGNLDKVFYSEMTSLFKGIYDDPWYRWEKE